MHYNESSRRTVRTAAGGQEILVPTQKRTTTDPHWVGRFTWQVKIFQPADVHNDFLQFLLCRRILDNPVLFTAVHQRTMTTSTEGPFVFTRDMVQQSSPHILHISFKHYQFQCRKEFHRTAQICNEHELWFYPKFEWGPGPSLFLTLLYSRSFTSIYSTECKTNKLYTQLCVHNCVFTKNS